MIKTNKTQDVFMQIRIDKETRDKFREVCDENAINSSMLIRKWIQKYIKDHENK